jgi:hypothetical protein
MATKQHTGCAVTVMVVEVRSFVADRFVRWLRLRSSRDSRPGGADALHRLVQGDAGTLFGAHSIRR